MISLLPMILNIKYNAPLLSHISADHFKGIFFSPHSVGFKSRCAEVLWHIVTHLKVMVSGSSGLFMPITSITLSTVDAFMTDTSVHKKLSIFFRYTGIKSSAQYNTKHIKLDWTKRTIRGSNEECFES